MVIAKFKVEARYRSILNVEESDVNSVSEVSEAHKSVSTPSQSKEKEPVNDYAMESNTKILESIPTSQRLKTSESKAMS